MEGRFGFLLIVQHLLIEFLTLSQTRVFDLHVFRPGEVDHTLCQFRNTERLTHIKHEDLTAITLGTGLQHQLTGLRNQHEVAHDVLICDRHRTAVLNLFTEQGDHRAV